MKLNRRTVLAGLGGLFVGSFADNSIRTIALAATPAKSNRFEQIGGDFSWKPQRLDIDEVAKVAHEGFHHKGYG